MSTTAERKALEALFAEAAPVVIFGSGEGDGHRMVKIANEVDGHLGVYVVAVPPAGASPELLAAYSARATAVLARRCPSCAAIASHDGPTDELMVHAHDCPASTEALTAALAAHWRTPRNAPCPCGSGRKAKHCHLGGDR